jgi:hypothetical protein
MAKSRVANAGAVRKCAGASAFRTPSPAGGVDRVLLVPFQSTPATAAATLPRQVVRALRTMRLREDGLVFMGEVAGDSARFVAAPFFPPDPVGIVVAGSPGFVASFQSGFARTIGAARLLSQDLDRIPSMPLLAASASGELRLSEEGALAASADTLAAGGWDVLMCDEACFDVCVALPAQAWIEQVSAVPSTHLSLPPKEQRTLRTRRAAPEPGEPHPGDQLVGIGVGQGVGTVVEVERRGGRWTRVKVAYAMGCMPVPQYEGQLESEWRLPSGATWLTREEVERLMAR